MTYDPIKQEREARESQFWPWEDQQESWEMQRINAVSHKLQCTVHEAREMLANTDSTLEHLRHLKWCEQHDTAGRTTSEAKLEHLEDAIVAAPADNDSDGEPFPPITMRQAILGLLLSAVATAAICGLWM